MALAKRVRELCPEAFIVAGGANVEGCMGVQTLSAFPGLDAVVSGEGDVAFPELVERVLAGRATDGIALAVQATEMARTSRDTTFTMYALSHHALSLGSV